MKLVNAIRQRHKIKILRLRLIIGFILFFFIVLFFRLHAFLLDPQVLYFPFHPGPEITAAEASDAPVDNEGGD